MSRRESLFDNHRRSRQTGRSPWRWIVAGVVALVAALVLRERVLFDKALYDGRRAVARHDFTAARAAYERAWQLKPGHPNVLDGAGFVFLEEQGPEWRKHARDTYAQARAAGLRGDFFINHVVEARRYLDAGAYDQAEVELEHTLELSPHSAPANLLAGHLLYAQGKLGKAIEQYQRALALSPRSEEIKEAVERAQEAKSRGSLPYVVDRRGEVLAALDAATGASVYPKDFLTAHVVGYRSAEHGRSGIEAVLGDKLRGNTVTLTIDANLQRIADAALGWQKGAIVILKPQTGEILAAVSHPGFRPSQIDKMWGRIKDNPNDPLRNRPFESLYEPGSIAKTISAAAILESHVDVAKLFPFRCRGYIMIGKDTFWDWKPHRTVESFMQGFGESCNVAMARIAPLVGPATITQFMRSFGFAEGDHLNLELPVAQDRAPLDPETPLALANAFIGLGSNYRITPLHAAMIAAAVGNGGVMMAPTLIKEVRSVTGSLIYSASPKIYKISVKKETAAALTRYLIEYVRSGIGRKAALSRYTVAGKTGTSGNPKRIVNGWFICFVPAEKPQLAMAVICENGGMGHVVAAPVAQRVLSEALP